MAVVAGAVAALIPGWRACVGVTVFAALVFVGFLMHRYGELTGDASAWPCTVVIVFGAVLGRGRRWMRSALPAGGPSSAPAGAELAEESDDRARRSVREVQV